MVDQTEASINTRGRWPTGARDETSSTIAANDKFVVAVCHPAEVASFFKFKFN